MPYISKKYLYMRLEGAARFSHGTRGRIERALGRTASAPSRAHDALRAAVRLVVAELIADGVEPDGVEPILREIVAEAGVLHGANAPSIISQSPRWQLVEERVIRWAASDVMTEIGAGHAKQALVTAEPRALQELAD